MILEKQAVDVTLAINSLERRVFLVQPTGEGRLYYVEGRSNAGGGSPGFNLAAVTALAEGDRQSIAIPPGQARGFYTFGDGMEIRALPFANQAGSVLVRVWSMEGGADKRDPPWGRVGSAQTLGSDYASAVVGPIPPYATRIAGSVQNLAAGASWVQVFGRRVTEAGTTQDTLIGWVAKKGHTVATVVGIQATSVLVATVPPDAVTVDVDAVYTALGGTQGSDGLRLVLSDGTREYVYGVPVPTNPTAINLGGVMFPALPFAPGRFTQLRVLAVANVIGTTLRLSATFGSVQNVLETPAEGAALLPVAFAFDIPASFYSHVVLTSSSQSAPNMTTEIWAA